MMADLRYAVRALLRTPGFTIAAVLTLALGIGVNATIFSVIHGVLLRPLPYGAPERLVQIYGRYPEFGRTSTSLPDYRDWRDGTRSFEQMAARHGAGFVLTGEGEPERVNADRVTSNFFTALGVRPQLGRAFLPEEDKMGGDDDVVVLSHGYWQRRFGGDPRIVGRQLQLGARRWTVVGVAPKGFYFSAEVDLWAPTRADTTLPRRAEYLDVFARLKPGVTMEQASADLAEANRRLTAQYPETNGTLQTEVMGMQDDLVKEVRPALLAFMAAVALVLLIACANVANLQLVRAAARDREMAVRVALGAGRGRLVRQMLTESVVLAVGGGLVGVALASWGLAALRAMDIELLPRQSEIGINSIVLAFSLGLSLLTGLLFGFAPALRLSRGPLQSTLREGARGSTGGALARVRSALVLGEVAVALVLLVGAGLLVRSFERLTRVDVGFQPASVLTYRVTFPSAKFRDIAQLPPLYDAVLERARALPGVRAAAFSQSLPMGDAGYLSFAIDGRAQPPSDAVAEDLQPFSVSPDYFSALRIPLRSGRAFLPSDRPEAQRVAVINEEMARRFFDGRDPIGRRVTLGDPADTSSVWWTIVGVVGSVAQEGVTAKPYPQFYRPIAQLPTRNGFVSLQTSGEPTLVANAAREAVRAVDRDLLVDAIEPLEARVAKSIARPRVSVILLTAFSGVALLLAAVGIYGVMAYTVTQRTREIGVRMALGADPGAVKRLIVSQAMRPALIGVAVGLAAALYASRLIASMLYGVSAIDPITFILVPLFLSAIALLATYLPARRATLVPPTVALQSE
jgi:predicted permease